MQTLAKLTRPSPKGIFPRKRLFRRLDQARTRPVIFITAPPGSGKTSLVTSYLKDRKLPCLWYQVDEGDVDVASFFYYMGLAAKHAVPRRRKPLPLLTPEYLMGIRTFTLRYFEDLYGRLKAPFTIVLDNYQEVPEDSSFQEVIRNGLSKIPKGIAVIILSRSEPPQGFAPMQANRLIEAIGWDELKLRYEETKGIIRQLRHERFPDEILHRVHSKADGWAAGLVLIAERGKAGPVETLSLESQTPKEIFNYFAGVILEKTESETRAFLEKTSFFPKFTVEMARELTQNPQASGILLNLHRNNYFTQRHATPTPVYEYHNLFREFLLARAKEVFPPEDLPRIRHDAASLCEVHGQVEDAVESFLKTGEWGEATRLIQRHAPALIAQGRVQTLCGWIETMPESTVQESPWLLYWKGICEMPYAPLQSRQSLEKAFGLFEATHDPVGSFLSWCGIVRNFLNGWDDMKPLDPWIVWLDQRMAEQGPPLPLGIHAMVAVHMLIALTQRKPDHPDALTWIEQALSLSGKQPDIGLRIQAYSYACMYYLWTGEHAKAELLMRESTELVRLPGASPLALLGWKLMEIIYDWFTGSPESTGSLVSEALRVAQTTGVHVFDFLLHSYGIASFLSGGEFTRAADLLTKMESNIDPAKRNSVSHYHLLAGWHALLVGDLPGAMAHAEKGVQLSSETGLLFGEALNRIQMAYVLHLTGRHENAYEHLMIARDIAARMKSPYFEWMCLLADAWFKAGQRKEEATPDSLRRAMAISREKGYVIYEGWLPSVMTELCLRALDSGIEVEYVRNLIRKRGLIPDTPPYEFEDWPWSLKLFTLGRFEIVRDEKPLQYPVRAPRVPLTLLKAIIAFGSRGVKEDQLVDTLWPEADGDTAHQTFKTTLHRLRQLIGDERAVQVREGRVTLDQQYGWVDAYAFEFLLEKAERLFEENQKAEDPSIEGVRLAERALSLYKGPFLGEEANESWVIAYQERLRSKFIRAVKRLGDHFERSGLWERAVECYQKGLEADELAEEFYQRLMASYLSSDRRAEAIAVYNRCRKVLKSALGIDPSPRTEEVFKALKEKVKE